MTQGTCRWCGQVYNLLAAEGPAEADRMAEERCDCEGAILQRRLRNTRKAVERVCEEEQLSPGQMEVAQAVGAAVAARQVDKGEVTMSGCRLSFSRKSSGTVRVRLTRKQENEEEVPED